ncbi:MAG: hypothetical protein EBS48_07570 [Actinobacteria bacterium]|jgi:hypothetical protein|nr:hypothetical protein [Actinomycetota bacterium]
MKDPLPDDKTFRERFASLIRVDCIRTSRLLETCQYACVYTLLCLPLGIAVDSLFAKLHPAVEEGKKLTKAQLWKAVFVCALQVIVDALAIFYVRKVANLVPFLFNICPRSYVAHYHVDEFFGEAAIAIIFVGVQTGLVRTLELLRKQLF